jgi:hypothetical protein
VSLEKKKQVGICNNVWLRTRKKNDSKILITKRRKNENKNKKPLPSQQNTLWISI